MNTAKNKELHARLGRLFNESLNVSMPVAMLHLTREKMGTDSYAPYYKQEIMEELGRLQQITRELNSEMLGIHELLKKEG